MVTVATPVELLRAAEASVVPLLTKFTVPVFTPVTAESTMPVRVTLVPGATAVALLMLLVNVVVVGASVTVIVWVVPELAA